MVGYRDVKLKTRGFNYNYCMYYRRLLFTFIPGSHFCSCICIVILSFILYFFVSRFILESAYGLRDRFLTWPAALGRFPLRGEPTPSPIDVVSIPGGVGGGDPPSPAVTSRFPLSMAWRARISSWRPGGIFVSENRRSDHMAGSMLSVGVNCSTRSRSVCG